MVDVSGCPVPCTETLIKTVYLNDFHKTSNVMNVSRVDIAFFNKVDTYITDFPSFHFSTFLASLGGTLGLWMGLGILQILDSVITTVCKHWQCCRKEVKPINVS